VIGGCGGSTPRAATKVGVSRGGGQLVAVGKPVPGRVVMVLGSAGTIELSAADPGRSRSSSLFATLIRAVKREPGDVCFGVYASNESPEDGDVGCQVRGHDPLVSRVGEVPIPGRVRAVLTTYLLGQAPSDVTRVQLIGPSGTQALPLSTHRMFLARFASATRGTVRLVAEFSDGRRFARAFNLPISGLHADGRSRRYRRPGAVFNGEVGENIVSQSYRQLVNRFGNPLRTFAGRSAELCAYYDVVGYSTGWVFCFKHGAIVSAAGSQTPPAGVH
jgi:hypothetical protein